jgi:acetyl/propionyl-CoA carboxylase alpha subunit
MTKLAIAINDQTVEVRLDWIPQDGNQLTAEVGGRQIPVTLVEMEADWDGLDWIIVDGRPIELTFDPCLRWICASGYIYPLEIRDLEAADTWPGAGDGRIKVPIPGLITTIFVEEGQKVLGGQPLLVLEAMKMENEIRASMSGVIESINVSPGQSVAKQDLLVKIAEF